MKKLLVVLVALLLGGCAAQDRADCYTLDEIKYAIDLAYDTGHRDGLADCPPCPDLVPGRYGGAAQRARDLTNDMLGKEDK